MVIIAFPDGSVNIFTKHNYENQGGYLMKKTLKKATALLAAAAISLSGCGAGKGGGGR